MRLFTRTLLQGLHDGLVEHGGMPPFPNDKIASAIFDEIATDAGLPPYLERRLDKTAAVTLSRAIAAYSEKLAGAGMAAPPERVALVKQASQRDLGERAMIVASYYMQKAADEGSLVPSGPNTLAAAAAHDQIAAVDQTNRPEGRYGVPIGTTDMPVPGMIGREMAAPGAPTVGATYKGADIIDPALLEDVRDWFARQGNAVADGVWNIPGTLREGARQVHEFGQDLAMSPQKHMRGIADAEFVRLSDPSNGAQRAAMEAAQSHHLGRIQARTALGTLGALGLGYGAYRGGKALYDHLTDKEASLKIAYGLGAMDGEIGGGVSHLPDMSAIVDHHTAPGARPPLINPDGWEAVARAAADAVPAPARPRIPEMPLPVPASIAAAAEEARRNAHFDPDGWEAVARAAAGAGPAPARPRTPEMPLPVPASIAAAAEEARRNARFDRLVQHPPKLVPPTRLQQARAAIENFGKGMATDPRTHYQGGRHGMLAAQGLGALGIAGGLAYGGKKLYDHLTDKEAAYQGFHGHASDGSDDALAPIIQACQEAGIEPTPEVIAALHHAMTSGGEGAAPPPAGEDKQADLSDIVPAAMLLSRDGQHFADAASVVGRTMAEKTRSGHIAGAAKTLGRIGGGVAAAGAAAALANHVLSDKDKEKKAAYWDAVIKAAGEGSLTPSAPNTLAAAAEHDQIAAVDKKNRPEGKYKVPVGQTQLSTAAGEIGAQKKVAEDAYWANVKQAAVEWGPYLPAAMPLEQKRQAIAKVASLAPEQREQFVRALHG